MKFGEDTVWSVKGRMQLKTDVVWDYISHLWLVTGYYMRGDDLFSPAQDGCGFSWYEPHYLCMFWLVLQGWVRERRSAAPVRLWFPKEDCRSYCSASFQYPLGFRSAIWKASLTVCFQAPFCPEDYQSSDIHLHKGSHAKVSIKDGTSKGSRRDVSVSLCFPASSPASILQCMQGCTQDAWAGKGPTSAQSPVSVTMTLSHAFLARWRKTHAALHVCSVNKGNRYQLCYILPKL